MVPNKSKRDVKSINVLEKKSIFGGSEIKSVKSGAKLSSKSFFIEWL